MATTGWPFVSAADRLATFFDPAQSRAYGDTDIDEIANLLEQCAHVGRRCPRTYIVLRTIGELEAIEKLLDAGFSDQWFPVEARGLPSFLSPSIKAKIVQSQNIIFTKSLDLEHGRHRHFAPGEELPFEIMGRLGSGGYGQVDRIKSKLSFRVYALKRIRRRAAFGTNSREAMKSFLGEINIVKSLDHQHIIQYIGSYTDKTYLGIVMYPVADTDLAAFMEQTSTCVKNASIGTATSSSLQLRDQALAAEFSATMRTFFGCLSTALNYLHDRSVRHKDIKPQNILIQKGHVILTDFGLSRDFADDVGSTTSGVTPASPRYSPPEVAAYEARNTSADIWSLGCVFFEMVAALHGINVDWMKQYFASAHSTSTNFYANPEASAQLIREWESVWSERDRLPLGWIRSMLLLDRPSRPTAARVLELITTSKDTGQVSTTFCGICCIPDEETDSDDSLDDEINLLAPTSFRQQPHSWSGTYPPQDASLTELKQSNSAEKVLLPKSVPAFVPATPSQPALKDVPVSSPPLSLQSQSVPSSTSIPTSLPVNSSVSGYTLRAGMGEDEITQRPWSPVGHLESLRETTLSSLIDVTDNPASPSRIIGDKNIEQPMSLEHELEVRKVSTVANTNNPTSESGNNGDTITQEPWSPTQQLEILKASLRSKTNEPGSGSRLHGDRTTQIPTTQQSEFAPFQSEALAALLDVGNSNPASGSKVNEDMTTPKPIAQQFYSFKRQLEALSGSKINVNNTTQQSNSEQASSLERQLAALGVALGVDTNDQPSTTRETEPNTGTAEIVQPVTERQFRIPTPVASTLFAPELPPRPRSLPVIAPPGSLWEAYSITDVQSSPSYEKNSSSTNVSPSPQPVQDLSGKDTQMEAKPSTKKAGQASRTTRPSSNTGGFKKYSIFSRGKSTPKKQTGVFGVPLSTSIPYANTEVSLFDENGKPYVYGHIPIVVGKCGFFLKENGTETDRVLTTPGNDSHVEQLITTFNSPERRYGRGMSWNGYTVYDAATALHRYLCSLPSPLFPQQFAQQLMFPSLSEPFRHPTPNETENLVLDCQATMKELPILNRHLLLWLLDILAVFLAKADLNNETMDRVVEHYHNAVFGPCEVLDISMRQKLMLGFLIENQDFLLIKT
ncbi:hypothetical protein BU24DRAFT_418122 [Aaosphaeria arxii CBS 175.79]|uniref:non-specific serine/threonine protein kinase n=1 Tax=Aaosphaeria arxii CBS 175.79 TaxID=1450172 RepID=A0A6A5Y1B2_9PLEO|nr:uncharacterized protein BU24DRAFT_418122 [Aaosphaeria arxii CBS 175.79]KAF2018600.1 hypothetical protein BU24DRAFT_418122 [Aaosphaeria arxii CBS 175.79]